MRICEAYGPQQFGLSFELFPPKTPAGERTMFRHLEELMAFEPSFVTCTYGAGGSTRDKTLSIVEQVRQKYNVPVASHLTCVGCTVDELRNFLHEAVRRGIENIVALRGDPPQGETSFKQVEGGLRYANELAALIRAEFPQLGLAVAGYPEKHQEAESPEIDLENLKRKVEAAGETVVITQLFYDNDDFFRFRDDCERVGIDVPIVPGILPITNFAQIQRITAMCAARLPAGLTDPLSAQGEDEEGQFNVGVDWATRQVQGLIDGGVPGVHFYVLNKSPATVKVLQSVTRPA